MPSKFNCPVCRAEIVIRSLGVGEMCKCRSCGADVLVPGEVVDVVDEGADDKPDPSSVLISNSVPKVRVGGHGLRAIHFAAIIANGLYVLLYLIGLSVQSTPPEGRAMLVVYFAFPIVNVVALLGKSTVFANVMIGGNIAFGVLNLLFLAVNDNQQVKVGAFMTLMVCGISAIALNISRGESWLSLILERKRLEKKRKIDALQDERTEDNHGQ